MKLTFRKLEEHCRLTNHDDLKTASFGVKVEQAGTLGIAVLVVHRNPKLCNRTFYVDNTREAVAFIRGLVAGSALQGGSDAGGYGR